MKHGVIVNRRPNQNSMNMMYLKKKILSVMMKISQSHERHTDIVCPSLLGDFPVFSVYTSQP